jgi:hypothetical protein
MRAADAGQSAPVNAFSIDGGDMPAVQDELAPLAEGKRRDPMTVCAAKPGKSSCVSTGHFFHFFCH